MFKWLIFATFNNTEELFNMFERHGYTVDSIQSPLLTNDEPDWSYHLECKERLNEYTVRVSVALLKSGKNICVGVAHWKKGEEKWQM